MPSSRNQFLEEVYWWLDWIIKWLLEELVASVALMPPKQQYPTPQMRRHLNHQKEHPFSRIYHRVYFTLFNSNVSHEDATGITPTADYIPMATLQQ